MDEMTDGAMDEMTDGVMDEMTDGVKDEDEEDEIVDGVYGDSTARLDMYMGILLNYLFIVHV